MQKLLKKLFIPIVLLMMTNTSFAQRDFSKPHIEVGLALVKTGIFTDLWVNDQLITRDEHDRSGEEGIVRTSRFTSGSLAPYVKNGSNKYVLEFTLGEKNAEYYQYRDKIYTEVAIGQKDINRKIEDFDKKLVMLYASVDENDQIQIQVPEFNDYWRVEKDWYFPGPKEKADAEFQWMRGNMVVERIGDKVRVTINAISFGLPQPLWEYGVTFNEAEHRKLLEEAYQNYWQALKTAKDDTTELKTIYAKALEDRAKSSSVDSSFKLLQLDKFSRELALQPLGNLEDYVVEVKDGKKARLVLPNNRTISPIIFTQSRFILPDKNVSLTPYFSIIDGKAVLSDF